MRILFLSRWFPYPPDNGARMRVYNLLTHLARHHAVDLISFTEERLEEEQLEEMQRSCRMISSIAYRPFQPGRMKAMLGLFSSRPRSVIDTFNQEMMDAVRKAASQGTYDVVIASQIDMAPYALAVPGARKLLEELEITKIYGLYAGERRPIRKLRNALTWIKLSRYVAGLLRWFDGCTVVSEPERAAVLKTAPGYQPLCVVPNGVNAGDYQRIDPDSLEPDSLIYSGALTYQANFEAVEYFLREIYPAILARRPKVKLYITGRTEGVPLEQLLHREQVVFTGYLQDIRPLLSRCWANVVPLVTGGGTRLKILESLAAGTPVVSTTKGVEGLELVPGRDLLIADAPADFAEAVLRMLDDRPLREQLASHGRAVVAANYDWQPIAQRFVSFIEETVAMDASSYRQRSVSANV